MRFFKKRQIPQMTEESAAMMAKYNRACSREDIVKSFHNKLNTEIYNNSKLGIDHMTITNIPSEVSIPNLTKELEGRGFKVGTITSPYNVIAIKWNVK